MEGSVEDNQLWSSEYVEDWFLQEDMKAAGYDGFLVSDCRGDEDGINVGVYDPAKVTIVKRIKENNRVGTQQLQDYVSGIRKELQGVDGLAGLDHQMAVLCLAIWNMKLSRTEEDPTKELINLWNEGKGNYCTSDGRRPGKKEAEALRPLIQEFNDIIADMEENRVASERVKESFPHKNAIDSLPKRAVKKDFCRDINSKRLVTGNRVNTPDGEGDIEKISGTHGEYFVTVNGTDYKATDCYRVMESRENPEFVRIARVREAVSRISYTRCHASRRTA